MRKVETREDAIDLLVSLRREINSLDAEIDAVDCDKDRSEEDMVRRDLLAKIRKTRVTTYSRRLAQFGWLTGWADDYLPEGVDKC